MPEVKPNVKLLRYTPAPEELVAMAGKLCYSPASLDDLQERIETHDQSKYLKKLTDMGHLSPIEHASFTFGIEGVSRSLLAQITRHRIASFSVQSQRYVAMGDEERGFDYVMPPAIRALGEAIYFFHAKDTKVDELNTAVNGVLDTKHYGDEIHRSWIFRSVGYGHAHQVWKDMMSNLRMVGYDGCISIEHEDSLMSVNEGLMKAIAMLKDVMIFEKCGGMWWA